MDGAGLVPNVASGAQSSCKRARVEDEAGLVASTRKASKMQLYVSKKDVVTARKIHWESQLEKLCNDKRHQRRQMNDVKHSDNPSDAMIQFYIEELQGVENENIGINA